MKLLWLWVGFAETSKLRWLWKQNIPAKELLYPLSFQNLCPASQTSGLTQFSESFQAMVCLSVHSEFHAHVVF